MAVKKIVGLTEDGKEELALALLLWKDFKSDGVFDVDITYRALMFADMLDVREEFDELLSKLPVMKIVKR